MGKPHQAKVSVNPLHVTAKIEHCERCPVCEQVLHRDAFTTAGVRHKACRMCRLRHATVAENSPGFD